MVLFTRGFCKQIDISVAEDAQYFRAERQKRIKAGLGRFAAITPDPPAAISGERLQRLSTFPLTMLQGATCLVLKNGLFVTYVTISKIISR